MSLPLTDANGVVQTADNGTPVSWSAGLGYDVDGYLCVTTSVLASDSFVGAKRVSASGQLVVTDSVGGPFNYNAGWPTNQASGATIRQIGTPSPTDPRVAGVAIGPLGGVYMNNAGVPRVSSPVFSPAPGLNNAPVLVSIITSTPGATIRYTTDGSTPSETVGTIYTAPFLVDVATTVKAIAYDGIIADSYVTSADYNFQAIAPTFTPPQGTYAVAQNVAIASTTPGVTIRYTTDGSDPSETVGTIYTVPIAVANPMTLKAVAYKAGWIASPIAQASYIIDGGQVVAPVFDPVAGEVPAGQLISMSTATAGAIIRYTTDGSTPSPVNGTVYSTPVSISSDTTFRAMAYKSGMSNSNVTTAAYTIQVVVLWTPAELFLAGEKGAWYDPNVMSSMFQDAAGTIPVTAAGQPVGRMLDLSGNGNHLVQATAANRPVLRQGAAWFLEFNGVNNGLATAAAIAYGPSAQAAVFVGIETAIDTVPYGPIGEYGNYQYPGNWLLSGNYQVDGISFQSCGDPPTNQAAVRGNSTALQRVQTGLGNIATPSTTLRIDGIAFGPNVDSQGTGGYGDEILYIGERIIMPYGGYYFAGAMYAFILRSIVGTPQEVAQAEDWIANQMGILIDYTTQYNYTAPPTASAPLAGQIQHGDNFPSKLNISKTDGHGVQHTLENLTAGAVIKINGVSYTVQGAPLDSGSYVAMSVIPSTQQPDGTYTVEVILS